MFVISAKAGIRQFKIHKGYLWMKTNQLSGRGVFLFDRFMDNLF